MKAVHTPSEFLYIALPALRTSFPYLLELVTSLKKQTRGATLEAASLDALS